jgi:hypothetical protein
MKNWTKGAGAMGAAAIVLAGVAIAQQTRQDPPARGEHRAMGLQALNRAEVDRIIASWPAKNREVAREVMGKYGPPHEATPMRLVWWNNGPWKFTMLVNHEVPHNFPMPHPDMLYQAINYNVPIDKYNDLVRYDGSLIIERTRGTLGARCDKEGANFLAINLAHDIVNETRTVTGARNFYAETMKAKMENRMNEEQRRYTSGFTFQPPQEVKGDPDKPHGH